MWRRALGVTGLLGVSLLAGIAHAGSDPSTTAGALSTPRAPSEVPLVLSIRALSMGVTVLPQAPEVERVTAPTGEGTTRWPTGEIAKGVYISVMPACIPGVDEPFGPVGRRPHARRR